MDAHYQSLAGKVAVVTGASSGIGRGIALALANQGVKVALGARRKDRLEEVQQKCCQLAKKVLDTADTLSVAVSTDVTVRSDFETLVQTAERELGPVDILVW